KVVRKHANGGATLQIADAIKDLVDVKGIADRDMDGVTGPDTVQLEGSLHALVDELGPNIPIGVEMVDSVPADPGSKALVHPQLIPPVHSDEVTEPLVTKLVCDVVSDRVPEPGIGSLFVIQNLG